MAPPHLHPRSRMTSTLFATTVAASFFVVALPHILPCPAPRTILADGDMSPDGTAKRRRRRIARPEGADGESKENKDGMVEISATAADLSSQVVTAKRECPVPKPKGMLGELFGFTKDANNDNK